MEKISQTMGNKIFSLKCGFGIGYSIGWKYLPIWISVSVFDLNQNRGFGRTLETRFNQLLPQWTGVSVACTAFYLSCLPCLLPSFCLCVCSLFLFWSQWFYLNIRGCLKIIIGAVAAFSMHFTFRTSNHIKQLWTAIYRMCTIITCFKKCFWPSKRGFKIYKTRVIMACIRY